MNFRKDEIIIILGAGASADAGIPVTTQMAVEIEKLINKDIEWSQFKNLYFLIKNSIEFSYKIQGKPVYFNIETLITLLNELQRKEMTPLYPFIGSWITGLSEIIKDTPDLKDNFKNKIIQQLKIWIQPDDLKLSEYYKKLLEFQRQVQFPLRIFSLNYDLLVEQNLSEISVERGFDSNKIWDYRLFSERPEEPEVYLYKLHGSIDWERDTDTQVVKCNNDIPDMPDLFFKTQPEMQYTDPYLFLFSEFRHYSMEAKIIICVGYSFLDERINAILAQALKNNKETKIYSVNLDNNQEETIKNSLACNKEQIIPVNKKAKEFFENDLNLENINNLVSFSENSIF